MTDANKRRDIFYYFINHRVCILQIEISVNQPK